jgi:hypothetical protein
MAARLGGVLTTEDGKLVGSNLASASFSYKHPIQEVSP